MVDVLDFNDEAIRLESSGLTLLFMHFRHPCCCTDTSTMQDMAFAVISYSYCDCHICYSDVLRCHAFLDVAHTFAMEKYVVYVPCQADFGL